MGKTKRDQELQGWIFTMLGVICFSLTFPMTALALQAFSPLMIALMRGSLAGISALLVTLLTRSTRPNRRQLGRMASAAGGMVVLFPWLTSWSLQYLPATHASVMVALLPLITAIFGVVLGKEKASGKFWLYALVGTIVVLGYSMHRSGFSGVGNADLILLVAMVACGYGYAEGGLLSRELGGWKVICWILVTALPLELVALAGEVWRHGIWRQPPTVRAWMGLSYLALVSQFLGFFFFYRGLALGGVARMSQLQLLQSVLALLASAFLLGEPIEPEIYGVLVLLLGSVYLARRSMKTPRISSPPGRGVLESVPRPSNVPGRF